MRFFKKWLPKTTASASSDKPIDLAAIPRQTLAAAIDLDPDTAGPETPHALIELARYLRTLDAEYVFSFIYHQNLWGSDESRSGTGSGMSETAAVRAALPALLGQYGITNLLDIPCGDFVWMKTMLEDPALTAITYTGADIVPDLIAENTRRYGQPNRRFLVADLVSDPLPQTDLILCRDCLVHLPNGHIGKALANIKTSAARWLLTTTFPDHDNNRDIALGNWRPLNLERAPFFLPPPVACISENMPDPAYADKSLALWAIADLPDGR